MDTASTGHGRPLGPPRPLGVVTIVFVGFTSAQWPLGDPRSCPLVVASDKGLAPHECVPELAQRPCDQDLRDAKLAAYPLLGKLRRPTSLDALPVMRDNR